MKLPRLTNPQIEKLSDISSDVGLVSLASVVLPAVLDKHDPFVILLGLIATIFFLSFSMWLRR